jgi:uroporphyrinogen decarboxylase
MTGKELLIEAIQGHTTPRPAWLPFVGCHGGKLIGKTAEEYLRSSELTVQGLRRAMELYRPDGLPVSFDLQLEAEVLGCELHWANEVPPAVISHPLAREGARIDNLPEFDPTHGRLPLVGRALDELLREAGEQVAFYGLICGPFTLALHLRGNDIFLDMFDDPEQVIRLTDYCAEIGSRMASFYLSRGANVVAVVDPMTSQISPEHFEQFVTPAVNKIFRSIRDQGGLSSMFVCGDVTRNLEKLCRTETDNVSVDEQIAIDVIRPLCEQHKKSFGGNIKLTSVLLLGDRDDVRAETLAILDDAGDAGFILAPGCDLPYNTPPENLRAVAELVHDPYQRDVARTEAVGKEADTYDDIQIPQYHKHSAVIVDVITLDSTSCAPCQYMMEAVEHAARDSPFKVYINEHKIKTREGLGMMAKLGVTNLPTICIDGQVAFASIIPDPHTLIQAIEIRANEKNSRNPAP